MKKNLFTRLSALLLALVMLFALAACSGDQPAQSAPASSGVEQPTSAPDTNTPQDDVDYDAVITMAIASGWTTLIPYNNATDGLYGMLVLGQLNDTLVLARPDGSLEPRLATSWESTEDYTGAIFHLDETATWHDGTPVTAEDFVFTAEMITDPDCAANYKTEFDVLAGVDANGNREAGTPLGMEALDAHTLKMTFDQPADLTTYLYNDVNYYPIPKHLLEDVAPKDYLTASVWDAPVGTGPCKFVSTVAGTQLVLEAYEDYHLGRPGFGQLVIEYMSATNMASALISGDIDLCFPSMSSDDVDLCAAYDHLAVKTSDSPSTPWMFVMANTYYKDYRVRQAFNYALDRELLCATLGSNFEPISSPVFPSSKYYKDDCGWEFNPEKAIALLKECEADGTFDFNEVVQIYTPAGDREKAATVIQQNLRDLGLTVDVITTETAAMFGGMVQGKIGIGMANFSVQPSPMYFSVMTSNESPSYVMADIPLWDEYKEQFSRAFTEEAKAEIMNNYQDDWMIYQPSIFYAISYDRVAYNAKLGDDIYYAELLSNSYNWPTWKIQVTK